MQGGAMGTGEKAQSSDTDDFAWEQTGTVCLHGDFACEQNVPKRRFASMVLTRHS